MRNTLIAGVAAVCLLAGGSFVSAQTSPAAGGGGERLTAADMSALTDARVAVVKAALQLTPEQMKLWPAVEDAIRSRAMARHLRLAEIASRMNGQIDLNPIKLMRDRADALSQRASSLKKLADAWQPLYDTLDPDQKRRMAILTVRVLREVRDRVQSNRWQDDDEDTEE
jgi:hypothetical protein